MTLSTRAGQVAHTGNTDDAAYDVYVERINARFQASMQAGPLFTTDASLWDAYLTAMPEDRRQYHTCHACKEFIVRVGGMVRIAEDGTTVSALWDETEAPEEYRASVAAMLRLVRRATVTGVFLSKDGVLGKPVTGVWHHFAVRNTSPVQNRLLTAGQLAAEKREDFGTVSRALVEWTEPQIAQALTLLRTDALYRSEKVLGQAEWLHALQVAKAAALGNRKANVVWRAIADAPKGFCHPRASMIGTLLDDIAAGLDFAEVSRRFREKMSPLHYQRPSAAPSAGAIAAAEKLVAEMGIAPAFARRYARLEDITTLWRPTVVDAPPPAGVFGHLTPRGEAVTKEITAPPTVITWEKFSRTVLPTATALEVNAPTIGNYMAFVTASDMDAPPIVQWDRADTRNPVTWYVYHNGSPSVQWGVKPGWARVSAVALGPSQWNGDAFAHHGKRALFVIDGAKDAKDAELCLFPELLRSELHGARSVIEAHSRSMRIGGREDASACGLAFADRAPVDVRVTTSGPRVVYRIDRWD